MKKRVLKNKKKLLSNTTFINQVMNDVMTEFSESRLQLFQYTKNWTDSVKIEEWKNKIKANLDELLEFDYLNDKKIRL